MSQHGLLTKTHFIISPVEEQVKDFLKKLAKIITRAVSFVSLPVLLLLLLICVHLEIRVDESVDITVHYRLDIAVLVARSGILCERVGHKYV